MWALSCSLVNKHSETQIDRLIPDRRCNKHSGTNTLFKGRYKILPQLTTPLREVHLPMSTLLSLRTTLTRRKILIQMKSCDVSLDLNSIILPRTTWTSSSKNNNKNSSDKNLPKVNSVINSVNWAKATKKISIKSLSWYKINLQTNLLKITRTRIRRVLILITILLPNRADSSTSKMKMPPREASVKYFRGGGLNSIDDFRKSRNLLMNLNQRSKKLNRSWWKSERIWWSAKRNMKRKPRVFLSSSPLPH